MVKNGFILCQGKNLYFLLSDKEKKCKSVTDAFITALCNIRHLCDDVKDRCLADVNVRKDIEYRYTKGTYELRTCDNGTQYHHFEEKYSIMNFPLTDCNEIHFI